jgi:methyl-accepting chemotaxis protein
MTSVDERFERIERNLERVTDNLKQISGELKQVSGELKQVSGELIQVSITLQEMAARQQYHDEAFERHDAEMKVIREAQTIDGENIRALVRIAELHSRRLEGLEGGEAT